MPYEQRERALAHIPLGEGYERTGGLHGPTEIDGREIALMPRAGVFKGRDLKKCRGNDDTCEGFRALGTEYCQGHLRSQAKAE